MPDHETDSREQKQPKNRPRFGLKSLLLAVAFVAVGLSAFQLGHQVGFKKGDRSGFAAGLSAKLYLVAYYVPDLVPQSPRTPTAPSLDDLTNEITRAVHPKTWESAGGPGTIAPDIQNRRFLILQTERAHDEIQTFLESKRAARGPIVNSQTATAQPKAIGNAPIKPQSVHE